MRLNKWLLSLAGVVFLSLPVLAQQPPRGGGFDLFANKSVQEELKIDADTAKKAGEVVTKSREKLTAAREKLTGEELKGDKGAKLVEENREETYKALADVLKPEQLTRYKQISFQTRIATRGFGGGMGGATRTPTATFAHEEVAKVLKLTSEQKEDVKKLNEDYGKARTAATQDAGNDRAKQAEAREKVSKEFSEKFQKVLTAEQKKTWDEVHGKPFTMQFQQPQRQPQQQNQNRTRTQN